jgi:hypothetical protein
VLSDNFWEHVGAATAVMSPAYFFVRDVDGNNCDIGGIFERIRQMGEEIQSCNTNDAAACSRLFEERLDGTSRKVGFHSPVHSAGMLLNPKNWEVNFQEKYGPVAYGQIRADLVDVVSKVSPDNDFATKALAQYDVEYKQKALGYFQSKLVISSALKISDGSSWWAANGALVPELQFVATRVLRMGIVNSAAERNWSAHQFIHSKSRNHLNFATQQKLVNIFCNAKLKQRMEKTICNYHTDEEFSESDSSVEADFEQIELQQEEELMMALDEGKI